MKDVLGQELKEGDEIVFIAYKSLKKGIYLREHKNGSLTVRPTGENRTIYIDTRSGKIVDPRFHVKIKAHSLHKETGAPITKEQDSATTYFGGFPGYKNNPDYAPYDMRMPKTDEYHDYLMKVEIPGGYARVVSSGNKVMKI